MRHDNFIPRVRIRSRGRLPHWEVNSGTYSITFRLRDSLPPQIVRSLMHERTRMLRSAEYEANRARFEEAFSLRLDSYLDAGWGSCILREHGETVASALRHFDGVRYDLHAWCVMPNHVHVLASLHEEPLEQVLHTWKSFTAHQIGLGVIWQREYFDRIIRSVEHFESSRAYIRANPAKAGLRNWLWVG